VARRRVPAHDEVVRRRAGRVDALAEAHRNVGVAAVRVGDLPRAEAEIGKAVALLEDEKRLGARVVELAGVR
jgi:hypothetical protein